MLEGKWTYRSYHNSTALVGDDANAALALIFGEGVFDFVADGLDHWRGTLDMGSNYTLSLTAKQISGGEREQPMFSIVGLGVEGTPTAGWRYDYHGTIAYSWPDGIDQVPALVGTVIRVLAHGPTSPAGVTASFIAVRQ
jgi:hypothetical protein